MYVLGLFFFFAGTAAVAAFIIIVHGYFSLYMDETPFIPRSGIH